MTFKGGKKGNYLCFFFTVLLKMVLQHKKKAHKSQSKFTHKRGAVAKEAAAFIVLLRLIGWLDPVLLGGGLQRGETLVPSRGPQINGYWKHFLKDYMKSVVMKASS